MKFSHRPTGLPGGDRETDREVLCDGLPVARVRCVEQGQQAGLWQWSAYWVSDDNRGIEAALDEALEAVKQRVTPETLEALPPGHRR